MAMSSEIMLMTTSNSINVKAWDVRRMCGLRVGKFMVNSRRDMPNERWII
jgi:hypothetical protein